MTAPLVYDLAPQRCPEIDPRDRSELKRVTPRPAGPLTKDDVRAWIDRLEASERKKTQAGNRVVGEYEQCRGVEAKSSPTS